MPCLSSASHDVTNVLLHVRAEDEDGAVHPGQEERGGGQPLSGTGGREAEGVSALSQHRVPGGLGHSGVVTGIFLELFTLLCQMKLIV